MIDGSKPWQLLGFDTFEGASYALSSHDSEEACRAAAADQLAELERTQPTETSGGQEGIQDRVFIVGPDNFVYRWPSVGENTLRLLGLTTAVNGGPRQSEQSGHRTPEKSDRPELDDPCSPERVPPISGDPNIEAVASFVRNLVGQIKPEPYHADKAKLERIALLVEREPFVATLMGLLTQLAGVGKKYPRLLPKHQTVISNLVEEIKIRTPRF